nr:monovalent cation/H(+) antiporter subunit G [Desulfuromonas versatilis]
MLEYLGWGLVLAGMPFFAAGTVGLLRFPDFFCRLHALTKADNLGLGLVSLGLGLQSGSWLVAFKLLLIWLLVLVSSAAVSHLMARTALRNGVRPWRRP